MDLTTLIPPAIKPDVAVEARIANTPEDAASDLFVIIDAYDPNQRFGPCYFMPKGSELPARDDPCLVVFDELRQPWVAVWWNGSVAGEEIIGDSLTVTGAVTSGSLVTGPLSATTGLFTELLNANAGIDVAAALSYPAYKSRQTAANKVLANNLISTDANYAFYVNGDGKHYWGAGGASAVDTTLYRSAADTLKTDDALIVTGTLTSGISIAPRYAAGPPDNVGSSIAYSLSGTGDSVIRWQVNSDGKIWFGSGSGSVDTNIYRSAADTLKTDDSLIVTGTLSSGAQTLSSATLSGTGKTTLSFSDTSTTTGLTIGGDTNLYRAAANVLKTDDALTVTGAVISDSYFQSLYGSGAFIARSMNSGSSLPFATRVSGDASDRFAIWANGTQAWGDGTAAADIVLSRQTVPLRLQLTQPVPLVATVFWANPQSASDSVWPFFSLYGGDSWQRFAVTSSGKILLGDGTATPSCNLYQTAANTLKTDDALVVTGSLTAGTSTLTAASATSSSASTGTNLLTSPVNTITAALGATTDVSALTANEWAGALRFIGLGVTHADLAFFPTGGGATQTALGNFRFSLSGAALDTTPDARVGVGHLYVASNTATTGIQFGGDTNLYRSAANTLKTDDQFHAFKLVALPTENAGATSSFATLATGDTNVRFNLASNGVIQFGDGTAATDTDLYRSAANVLKTNDQFVAVDGVTTKPVAGVVSDASFTATPASGTLAVDTTNSFLYVRVGSTWKKVAVA